MAERMTLSECQSFEWGRIVLPDYKTMYYELAAKISDAVELLLMAQQQGEIQFTEQNEDSELILLNNKQKNENKHEDKNQ